MKTIEITSSLYPNSIIKIPLGISRQALDRILKMLKEDYHCRGMDIGVKMFFAFVLGIAFFTGSYFVGYDRGVESGYKTALFDVYRKFNTTPPVTIAGAEGMGREMRGEDK